MQLSSSALFELFVSITAFLNTVALYRPTGAYTGLYKWSRGCMLAMNCPFRLTNISTEGPPHKELCGGSVTHPCTVLNTRWRLKWISCRRFPKLLVWWSSFRQVFKKFVRLVVANKLPCSMAKICVCNIFVAVKKLCNYFASINLKKCSELAGIRDIVNARRTVK
jgi:hypothetical protein